MRSQQRLEGDTLSTLELHGANAQAVTLGDRLNVTTYRPLTQLVDFSGPRLL